MTIKDNVSILFRDQITDISSELLMDNGKLKLLPYKDYEKFTWEDFRYFCHEKARYGIPTRESVSFINEIINGRSAIEIGSGYGDLGYHLGIPMTDSRLEFEPAIRAKYEAMGQPIIFYPDDVEKIDALEAVKKYKPQVVVASWVTPYSPYPTEYNSIPFGVKESEIFDLIETYILVGNFDTHYGRPLLLNTHREIKEPFIITRAQNQEHNRIWVINNHG